MLFHPTEVSLKRVTILFNAPLFVSQLLSKNLLIRWNLKLILRAAWSGLDGYLDRHGIWKNKVDCSCAFWVPDILGYIFLEKQDLSGKMVMLMSLTMVCSYLCLLIRTFETKSKDSDNSQNEDLKISKTNSKCVALGKYILTWVNMYIISLMSDVLSFLETIT